MHTTPVGHPYPELCSIVDALDAGAADPSPMRGITLHNKIRDLLVYVGDNCHLSGEAVVYLAAKAVDPMCELARRRDRDHTVGSVPRAGLVVRAPIPPELDQKACTLAMELVHDIFADAHSDGEHRTLDEGIDQFLLRWHRDRDIYVDAVIAIAALLVGLHDGEATFEPLPDDQNIRIVKESNGHAS